MARTQWVIVGGAVLVAATAFYVLKSGGGLDSAPSRAANSAANSAAGDALPELNQPALDDIDAGSRAAMRDLLRDVDDE